jgi:hypothetical protein
VSIAELLALLGQMDPNGLVTVQWISDRIRGATSESTQSWVTAEEFAKMQTPMRSSEWARQMCRAGRIVGAHRPSKEWLIPANAEVRKPQQPVSAQRQQNHFQPRRLSNAA